MTRADISRIMAIQFQCYASCYLESAEAFVHKLVMHPDGCFVHDAEGRVTGYIVFHPARSGWVAPIDFLQDMPMPDPECVYVHDLAVDPAFRGKGIGRILLTEAVAAARARGLDRLALVAVQDAEPFWERMGFLKEKDIVYGGRPAAYMVRKLGPE